MKTIVFYHDDLDGFGAAFATWMKLGDGDVQYEPITHNVTAGGPINETHKGCRLIFLDCFYGGIPNDFSTDILVIDHHPETLEVADNYYCPNYTFYADDKKSAALLAWHYWHNDFDPPLWAHWISDYDTWQHKLPNSKEFNLAASLLPKDFPEWNRMFNGEDSDERIQEIIIHGSGMRKIQIEIVERLANKHHLCVIDGMAVDAVNSSVWPNEICHELLTKHGSAIAGVYYFDPKREGFKWSLRSLENTVDVGFMCKRMGGGGHPQAGGFVDVSKVKTPF